jgi:cellulose synthase/poly-beta-1,6-N-acetylglucosamine synthase-like glycosyltransferase
MSAIHYIYWFSAFLLFYAYAGYPVLIWALSRLIPRERKKYDRHFLPTVSLLISSYNEENVIEEKIINSLSLNYPEELLEIIVISDGSTDRTDEIVNRYAGQGVALKHYKGRIGKTACLNKTVPAARGEIIVFSDANSMYDRDAVRNLVPNFADVTIGFVTGYTRYAVDPNNGVSTSIGIYSKIEKFTKKAESAVGSCVGADGALFAVRKKLYTPLQQTDINDFVIPLSVIRQGFRGVLEEGSFCTEKTAGDPRGEVRRQIRITNRTLRAIFNNIGLLNPAAYGMFPFELLSHKIAKFLAPFSAMLLVACTIALMNSGTGYRLFLLVQLLLLLFAWPGYRSKTRFPALSQLSSICRTFVAMNLAIVGGWLQFLRGETYTTWSPEKR